MHELFLEAKTGSSVDSKGFIKLVQRISSNTVPEDQIEQAFRIVSNGVESLSY